MQEQDTASNGQPHSQFGQRAGQLGDSAQQFFAEAKGAAHDLNEYLDLRGRVQRHPYAMLAAAAGIGYVLGGGLFTPLTGRVLRLGVRLSALPFVKEELVAMAEAALDGLAGKKAPGGDGPAGA
ncbi:MAG: hypothetical protein HYZ28_01545 [Myxococcales bacterium]|nr:hypothetical protein [Myxococcales bacterium]